MNTHEFRSQEYPIALVKVGKGRRAVDDAAVAEMVASIREVGLLNPITLNLDGTLIAGRHRLEAARRLGWSSIPSVVRTLDDLHAELAEIDENLVYAPLTALERGEQLKRRKVLYEGLHPETRNPAERGGPGRGNKTNADSAFVLPDTDGLQNGETVSSFTADTAAKTGRSERVIQEEVQIAERIAPEVKEMIRDTPVADHKTDLLDIARTPAPEQRAVAEAHIERLQTKHESPSQKEQRYLTVVGDEEGNIARSRLRQAASTAVHAARSLWLMDVSAVVGVLDEANRNSMYETIRDGRAWLDEMERALNQPLRMVKERANG